MTSIPRPETLLGQATATRTFEAALSSGRVAGAYLLHGPPGTGRGIGAEIFGGALLCERRAGLRRCGACASCRWNDQGRHPDFLVVTADRGPRFDDDAAAERGELQAFTRAARAADDVEARRTIPVRTLRRLMELLSLAPTTSGWRVVVVDAFDEIEDEGAAALLKTLEEAPPRTTFLLLTRGVDGVPDTILSRCQRVRFQPLAPDVVRRIVLERGGADARALAPAALDLVVRIAQGSAGRALRSVTTGLHERAAPAARDLLRGDDAAVEAVLAWVREGGRDLDSQRERSRELCALLILLIRDSWDGAPSDARIAAVRGALESIDSNVSPELALRALGVRVARSRAVAGERSSAPR